MSLPHFDFPDSPDIAGDSDDDDATVIDNLVEQSAEPPKPADRPTTDVEALTAPKPATRLITGTITLNTDWSGAELILPADPNRTQVSLTVSSASGNVDVYIADEKDKAGTNLSAILPETGDALKIDGHTGAIWATAVGDAATTARISWVAVTR